MPSPDTLIQIAWSLWAVSWIAAALWSDPPARRATSGTLALAYALIVGAIVTPIAWRALALPAPRLWDGGPVLAHGLVALAILGLLFTWWARLHLGRLWSAEIIAKADHRIVRSGPYGWVRHPIYTGLLWAAFCTDVLDATPPAALSFALLLAGFWIKARLEERFLQGLFERDAYAAYRRRVPMLLPFRRPG